MDRIFMRKHLFFLPVGLWTLLALFLDSSGVKASLMVWLLWLALLMVGGTMLQKRSAFGGLVGMIPGLHMIYVCLFQAQEAFQAELPLGILLVTFFFVSSITIYLQERKA